MSDLVWSIKNGDLDSVKSYIEKEVSAASDALLNNSNWGFFLVAYLLPSSRTLT